VPIGQRADRLDFDDHFAETDQVRPVGLAERPALIAQANLSWARNSTPRLANSNSRHS
jgi:hypothetical protein